MKLDKIIINKINYKSGNDRKLFVERFKILLNKNMSFNDFGNLLEQYITKCNIKFSQVDIEYKKK